LILKRRETDRGRMTGPEPLGLMDKNKVRLVPAKRGTHGFGLMAHHDSDGHRAGAPGRSDHMVNEGPSGKGVKHLRERGVHSFPLAGREDNRGERGRVLGQPGLPFPRA
jgi:hypothetical protein